MSRCAEEWGQTLWGCVCLSAYHMSSPTACSPYTERSTHLSTHDCDARKCSAQPGLHGVRRVVHTDAFCLCVTPVFSLVCSWLFHALSLNMRVNVTQCYFCCWASLRDFKCFIAPFFAPLFCVCFVFVYFSFGNKIMWSCRVRSILSSFCSDLSFCPSAGIPKTQSLNSTTSSLKRPPASTSLPAAPTMPGTSMTRRTRISWGSPPPLHPCHQAHIQHLHRTR